MAEDGESAPASAKRGWRDKLAAWADWFARRYMELDPRTLGFYRIVLGLLLCIDGGRHWVEARQYYSNDGVLNNHYHLFRPSSEFNFSLFHSFSTLEEVHIAFALSMLCYLLFTIGWHTRLFTILSTLWVTSMDNRLVMVENGGYVVVNLMCFWAMFLPMGRRLSVDSLLLSLRSERERTPHELASALEAPSAPVRSLAATALFFNFALVYIFNVGNKYGHTWRDGLTIHYVLHIDRMVTGLAVWVRETFPFWALWLVNHTVLVVEAMIIVLVLWPRTRLHTRPLAMILVAFLHLSFGLMMRLGPFSWFMIGWSTVLVTAVHWRALGLWYRRRAAPVTVRYRPDSALAFQFCRVLKRLDGLEMLTFEAAPEGGAWLTENDRKGRDALWTASRALPAGRWLVPAVRILSLGLADLVLALIDARSAWVGRFLGLRAAAATSSPPTPHAETAPARLWLGKWLRRLREATVVYLMVCAVSQLLNENKAIPSPFKHEQPLVVRATLQYPRIFQGWGMFAPNPIREDGIVAVDARTIEGRHVDPFTGTAPDLDLSDARGLGMNQIHQDYFNRIRLDRNRVFRKPLSEFIQRWHHDKAPNDEIVAFDVWWLRDQNPPPGSITPSNHQKICILSWRKPRFRPPKGQPPLERSCQVESAEKKDEEKIEQDKK